MDHDYALPWTWTEPKRTESNTIIHAFPRYPVRRARGPQEGAVEAECCGGLMPPSWGLFVCAHVLAWIGRLVHRLSLSRARLSLKMNFVRRVARFPCINGPRTIYGVPV